MKKQLTMQALYAASLIAISLSTIPAQAALTKLAPARAEQAIVEDDITPEAPAAAAADDEEVVVVKKAKPKTVVKKTTVVREQAEITPPLEAEVAAPVAAAPALPAATKPSTGQQLDAGVKAKMEDVQNQFEQALLKSLDRIKITIDDGAPQGVSTPNQSQVVQDNLVGAQSAEDKSAYMTVDGAPEMHDDAAEVSAGQTVAAIKDEKKSERKIRLAPVFGKSFLNSSYYNIDSRYTAGFELEMDVDTNFSVVLGYSYSQYNISLASGNAFYGYYQNYGYNTGNSNSLQYNQNLFEADGRVYLMPRESKFRIFGGAGIGYNLGYLNYNQSQYLSYYPGYNYGTGNQDYEVKSWLGLLSAGAQFNVSDSVSLGLLGKYALVFSSSQNQPINNYGFVGNGFNYGTSTDQAVIGGSIQKDSFYSVLGTVKVAF